MQPELQSNQSTYRVGTQELALQQQKVLRNTYLLLALTMVPTVIGAFIGMRTGGIIMQHPFISFFVLLGAVIGLQFATRALNEWCGQWLAAYRVLSCLKVHAPRQCGLRCAVFVLPARQVQR